MLLLRVSVIVAPDEDRFHAYCPALKGLHVDGDTVEEALERIPEAVDVYVDSLSKHGGPLPIGPDCQVMRAVPLLVRLALRLAWLTLLHGFRHGFRRRIVAMRQVELPWPSQSQPGIS